MLRRVLWENEEAHKQGSGVETVTVVLWDYEAKEGKAKVSSGEMVDVYLTDYSLGDLTIGVKPSHPSSEEVLSSLGPWGNSFTPVDSVDAIVQDIRATGYNAWASGGGFQTDMPDAAYRAFMEKRGYTREEGEEPGA